MTKRQIFWSFHFDNDCWRTNQVRNIGVIEGNTPVTGNDWEEVKRGRNAAIERWINTQLNYRSCTVVLVGAQTAERHWVQYEIQKSWELGKGVVGIHIHRLKDAAELPSSKGQNPFSQLSLGSSTLDTIVKCYDPVPNGDGKEVYAWFEKHLSNAVEEAIQIRSKYS